MFNNWCKSNNCENYIEWDFSPTSDCEEEPFHCVSCKLRGQSFNIDDIAEDCPYTEKSK